MVHKTSDLKVEILGVTPVSHDISSQEIMALSALLSFKGKSVRSLFREIKKQEKDLKQTVKSILLNSSLKGHASMATTPVLTISFQGSKFLDSMLTGIVFSSSLMASGRRTGASAEDIVFPKLIYKNKQAKKIYQETSKANIDFFQSLLDRGVRKDEASKILQYGMVGVGIISLSLESLISFKREYENEKEWMPEEAGLFLEQIEKKLKKLGLDFLWATREVAPRNLYPYPNIFKDPEQSNLVRDKNKNTSEVNFYGHFGSGRLFGLKKRLSGVKREKDWSKRLSLLRRVARDYNLAFSFDILSSVPWRVWGEKKRHRTVPMIVDSIYRAIEKGAFSLPPTIEKNKELSSGWLARIKDSVSSYFQLLDLGIKPRDAVFLIPRGVYIDVLQHFDLYNLLLGYYPLRLCTTAEEEMLRLTEAEVKEIKKILRKKGLGWLNKYIVPKCHICGFCPEKNFCGKIKRAVPDYDQKMHQQKQKELEKRFKKKLNARARTDKLTRG